MTRFVPEQTLSEYPWIDPYAMDLPVLPGDIVSIDLMYVSVAPEPPLGTPPPTSLGYNYLDALPGQYGQVSFSVLNSNQGFTLWVPEPPYAGEIGQCAEWILETPSIFDANGNFKNYTTMPELLDTLSFTFAGACAIVDPAPSLGPAVETLDPRNGTIILLEPPGYANPIAVTVVGPQTVATIYTGPF